MRKVFLLQLKPHFLEGPQPCIHPWPHEARDVLADPRLSPGFPLAPSPRFLCNPLVYPFRLKATCPPQEARPGSTSWKRRLLEMLHADAGPQTQPRRGSREPVSRSHHSPGKPLEGGRGSSPTPSPSPDHARPQQPLPQQHQPLRQRSTKTGELRNVLVERGLRSRTAKKQTEKGNVPQPGPRPPPPASGVQGPEGPQLTWLSESP